MKGIMGAALSGMLAYVASYYGTARALAHFDTQLSHTERRIARVEDATTDLGWRVVRLEIGTGYTSP